MFLFVTHTLYDAQASKTVLRCAEAHEGKQISCEISSTMCTCIGLRGRLVNLAFVTKTHYLDSLSQFCFQIIHQLSKRSKTIISQKTTLISNDKIMICILIIDIIDTHS